MASVDTLEKLFFANHLTSNPVKGSVGHQGRVGHQGGVGQQGRGRELKLERSRSYSSADLLPTPPGGKIIRSHTFASNGDTRETMRALRRLMGEQTRPGPPIRDPPQRSYSESKFTLILKANRKAQKSRERSSQEPMRATVLGIASKNEPCMLGRMPGIGKLHHADSEMTLTESMDGTGSDLITTGSDLITTGSDVFSTSTVIPGHCGKEGNHTNQRMYHSNPNLANTTNSNQDENEASARDDTIAQSTSARDASAARLPSIKAVSVHNIHTTKDSEDIKINKKDNGTGVEEGLTKAVTMPDLTLERQNTEYNFIKNTSFPDTIPEERENVSPVKDLVAYGENDKDIRCGSAGQKPAGHKSAGLQSAKKRRVSIKVRTLPKDVEADFQSDWLVEEEIRKQMKLFEERKRKLTIVLPGGFCQNCSCLTDMIFFSKGVILTQVPFGPILKSIAKTEQIKKTAV